MVASLLVTYLIVCNFLLLHWSPLSALERQCAVSSVWPPALDLHLSAFGKGWLENGCSDHIPTIITRTATSAPFRCCIDCVIFPSFLNASHFRPLFSLLNSFQTLWILPSTSVSFISNSVRGIGSIILFLDSCNKVLTLPPL